MAFPDYFTEPQQPLGTVYVVDDDEAVCDSVRWLLEAGNLSQSTIRRPLPCCCLMCA